MEKIVVGLACLCLSFTAMAQQKVVADKIAAIVGDKIVLRSEIELTIADIQKQGRSTAVPTECEIMDQLLTQKALLLQSEKDSLQVSDEDIEAKLENQIRNFIQMYGSKDALEQIAGRTIYQIKEEFRQNFRERELADMMSKKIVQDVRITPNEVMDFYQKIPPANLLFYESELQIGEIVVFPKASRDIELLAVEDLNEYKKEVEGGTRKFETLASLYSDDPGSKDKGGQYELNRFDKQWDPSFFNAVWRLKEGQISPVVKSKDGYHIIQMVSRSGDDAIIRHILRIPQITAPEIEEATIKLDSIRDALVAGSIGFGEAVAKYSDDENAKFTAGLKLGEDRSTFLTINQLDKDLVLLLKNTNLKAGEYSKPMTFVNERGKKGVRIIRLISRSEPHRENLKDDYDRIAQRALELKKSEALQKWFVTKIPTYYIMIDREYKACNNLEKWQKGNNGAAFNN